MQTTTNFELKKPESTDGVNISDLNYNADVIDEELQKRGVGRSELTAEIQLNNSYEVESVEDDKIKAFVNAESTDKLILRVLIGNGAFFETNSYTKTVVSQSSVYFVFQLIYSTDLISIMFSIQENTVTATVTVEELENAKYKANKVTTGNFFSPAYYPTINAVYELVEALADKNNLTMPTLTQ